MVVAAYVFIALFVFSAYVLFSLLIYVKSSDSSEIFINLLRLALTPLTKAVFELLGFVVNNGWKVEPLVTGMIPSWLSEILKEFRF